MGYGYDYQIDLSLVEQKLEPHLCDGFFFVDIGANDGVVADPIYPFVRRYGWRGIAVEPVPYVFEQLRANYAGVDGIIFEHAAIADEPRDFWFIAPGSGTVDYIAQGMGSLDRDRVLATITANRWVSDHFTAPPPVPEGLPPPVGVRMEIPEKAISDDLEDYLTSLTVPCLTFRELVDKHRVERIDFLNIDVEGTDHEVYAGIDFDRFRPAVICIELDGLPDGAAEAVRADLGARGYVFAQRFALYSELFVHPEGTLPARP